MHIKSRKFGVDPRNCLCLILRQTSYVKRALFRGNTRERAARFPAHVAFPLSIIHIFTDSSFYYSCFIHVIFQPWLYRPHPPHQSCPPYPGLSASTPPSSLPPPPPRTVRWLVRTTARLMDPGSCGDENTNRAHTAGGSNSLEHSFSSSVPQTPFPECPMLKKVVV